MISLALIGGGEFSFGETREVDELLLARLPADRRRIVFVPTASGSAEYAIHLGKYLTGIDPTVEVVNVPIYRGRDGRRQKNLEALLSAGMIYLGGGVSAQLLDTIRESPAELAMREAAANGAVIAAIGGAASCFGTWTHDARGVPIAGLNWLEQCVVEAGFDPQNDAPLRRVMSLPDISLGVGIPARAAVILDAAGKATIAGQGQIAAFRKPQ